MSRDLSFSGSCEKDLLLSKIWLQHHLPQRQWNKIYVLGSWYGNMGLILRWLGLDFGHLTNVDANKRYCIDTKKIYQLADFDRPYTVVQEDVNLLNYNDADLVINTSTNDIESDKWFRNIPQGTWVAIQCRNNQAAFEYADRPTNYKEFLRLFPIGTIHYSGRMKFKTPSESYERYMLIGQK